MKKKKDFRASISKLIQMNLAFHNLNKDIEEHLGISLVQYHFLQVLRDMPGTSPQRLAQAAGIHPSTLSQSIKRLLKKELIFAEEDPRDSRKKILGLTSIGESVLGLFEAKIESFLPEKTVSRFSESSASN